MKNVFAQVLRWLITLTLLWGLTLILAKQMLASELNTAAPQKSTTLVSQSYAPTILELYSSQGCSSCPPAQNWINNLQHHDGLWKSIIPIVYHVDYWDYIGWKDPYASFQYTRRQRLYAKENALTSVYTPGFVVNGEEWKGWFKNQDLVIGPVKHAKPVGVLTAKITQDRVQINFDNADLLADKNLRLNMAILGLDLTTKVHAGENARKTLEEDFIVLKHQDYTFINDKVYIIPETTYHAENKAIVIWLSEENRQKPIQAVAMQLSN